MSGYKPGRRLYLDGAGKVVEAGDPTRRTLLVHAEGTIPLAQARALGLLDEPAAVEEEKAQAAPASNKARAKAPANKAKE